MYNSFLFLVDGVKIIYNRHVANTGTLDIHNNVTHPTPYLHCFSDSSLRKIIKKTKDKYNSILDERSKIGSFYINDLTQISTDIEILALFLGDFTGVIWRVSYNDSFGNKFNHNLISFTNNTWLVDSDDVVNDILSTLSNCTMNVSAEYMNHLDTVFKKNKIDVNKNASDPILLKHYDVLYPYWAIMQSKNITLSDLADRIIIVSEGNRFWEHNKVDLTKVNSLQIKCPLTLMNSMQKQKTIYLNYYEGEELIVNPYNAWKDIKYDNSTLSLDRFTVNHSSKDPAQIYNPTLWHTRYIFDYINNATINESKIIDSLIGDMLLPSLLNINYVKYAELIVSLGLHNISINDAFEGSKLAVLDKVYSNSPAHYLPIVWAGFNSNITIESLSNLISFLMADYGILGSSYNMMNYSYGFSNNFDFPMQDYWIEPYNYLGYLSTSISKRFPSKTVNFNDFFNKLKLYYKHNDYLIGCALFKQVNLIKTYSLNKVKEFATFLLGFILDNEIDNYLSWDIVWMDDKINTIIDIMKLLLEFRNKYAIHYDNIGLVYLFALACTMTKHNYTIKDIQNNLISLTTDFSWVRINNYCLFQSFEKNLIELYANVLAVSKVIEDKYGGFDE